MGNPGPILVLTRPVSVQSVHINTVCVHRVAMMWVTVPCVWCQHHFCVSVVRQQHGRPACSSPHPPGGTETRLTHAKQLMSVDSLFWAEQNGKNFVIACTVVTYLWFLWTNIFATEHDTTKIILPFHSESNAYSSNFNISYWWKLPKISHFIKKIAIFTMCSKH